MITCRSGWNGKVTFFLRACFVGIQVQQFSVPFVFQRYLYFKHLYAPCRITHNPLQHVVHKMSQWSTTREISPMCCLPWNALYNTGGSSRIPTQKCADMSLDVSTFDKNVSKLCHHSQACRYRSIMPGVRNLCSPSPIYILPMLPQNSSGNISELLGTNAKWPADLQPKIPFITVWILHSFRWTG